MAIDAGARADVRRFHSILASDEDETRRTEVEHNPDYFHDLNLDQVVSAITAEYREYRLEGFFRVPLSDISQIVHRQSIMRDLEQPAVDEAIRDFARQMRSMRVHLERARDLDYEQEKQRWFLNAVKAYCDGVRLLGDRLPVLDLQSRGLQTLRECITAYVRSSAFDALSAEVTRLIDGLSAIRYALLIRNGSITVLRYGGEPEYTSVIESLFERFRGGATHDYRAKFEHPGRLDHVEAQVLDRIGWLYPELFAAIDAFCSAHAEFLDDDIARFDREIHFYLAYLAYVGPLRRAGLRFCYPGVSTTSKEVEAYDAFDIGLAANLIREGGTVVTNDFSLRDPERIIVVTGPNHGGKTTFARMFGQLHYLAALGCPVPGTSANLFVFDRLFTQFERQESIENLRGKLQDDLVRFRRTVDDATSKSIVIMNEVFSSTTVQDALFLSRKILAELSRLDLLAVCVTFLDELASFDEKTVSMVSTVDPSDPSIRTFKLVRMPANGLAYALAVAEKHRVTYQWLKNRIRRGS
jgi:hypothetical protein